MDIIFFVRVRSLYNKTLGFIKNYKNKKFYFSSFQSQFAKSFHRNQGNLTDIIVFYFNKKIDLRSKQLNLIYLIK